MDVVKLEAALRDGRPQEACLIAGAFGITKNGVFMFADSTDDGIRSERQKAQLVADRVYRDGRGLPSAEQSG